jgi:hypothetical protein
MLVSPPSLSRPDEKALGTRMLISSLIIYYPASSAELCTLLRNNFTVRGPEEKMVLSLVTLLVLIGPAFSLKQSGKYYFYADWY